MLAKASLADDMGGNVRFQFNPETLTFTSKAKLKSDEASTRTQYIRPEAIELTLKMLLDEVTGDTSVISRLETMLKWTRPKNADNDPYEVTFTWGLLKVGSTVGLKCHCTAIAVDYQLFNPQGEPVRALATVKLTEIVPEPPEGTNPTSGGELPARSLVLDGSADLAVLAHSEYGSTRHWRSVAERNGVDNPFRLPVGAEMIFPDRLELER